MSAARATDQATRGRLGGFVGWLVAERVGRGLVTFVVLGVVARHLGPAGFGALNTAIAVATLFMPLAMLGIDSLVVRDLVAEPARAGALLCTGFLLRVAAGAAALALVGAWSGLGVPADARLLWPAAVALLSQAGEVFDLWYRSRVQSRTTVVARSAVVAAGAAAKLALAAGGAGPAAFAWVYGAECAAFPALLALAYRAQAGGAQGAWRWDGAVALRWLRQGWGFLACGLLVSAAFRSDQLAVSHFLGDAGAGRYFAALRLVEIAVFVATALGNGLLPGLVDAARRPAEATEAVQRCFDACAALGWLCLLGAAAAGPTAVRLLYGPGFESALPVLLVYCAGNLAMFVGTVRGHLLVLRSASGTQAVFAGAMFAGQALGSLWLVPRLGLVGGAFAFAGTQFATVLLGPLVLPAARDCFVPQLRALLVPFRPRTWPRLARLFA